MPRDSSGNYTLPSAYNPVLTGTTITSTWGNTTLSDVATALTDSLSRSGKGGMSAALLVTDGTSGAPGLAFASEQTTGLYRNGASAPTLVVNGVAVWASNASKQFLVVTTTGSIFTAAASGPTITSDGAILITGSAAANNAELDITNTDASGGQWRIGDNIGTAAGTLTIYDKANSAARFEIVAGGGIIVPAPAAGVGLTVNGVAATYTVSVLSSASGQQLGLRIAAGSVVTDVPFAVLNQAATAGLLVQYGDGEIAICQPPASTNAAPTSGTNQLYQLGYLDSPLNIQNNNYTLVATDRGKTIGRSGATGPFTWTLPDSITLFPGGTIINVINFPGTTGATVVAAAGSAQLIWMPSGAGGAGSSRTLSASGAVGTLYQAFQNVGGHPIWYIWGQGIS